MDEKAKLKSQIEAKIAQLKRKEDEKKVAKYGHCFTPYTNRGGSRSWQQELDYLLETDHNIMEIFVPASNSSGKTCFLAYLAVAMLNGTHPICERFRHKKSIHIHIVADDKQVLKTTIQAKFEEITLGEITTRGFANRDRYKIISHNEILSALTHKDTTNYITFSSTKEGSTGLVGVRPDILLADEPVSEAIYNELVVRTTEKGSLFIQFCTAVDTKHVWIVQLCKNLLQKPDPQRKVITARMIDNPYVPMEKIEHLAQVYGENSNQYKVRVMGELKIIGGLVLDGFDKCIVPNDYYPPEYENGADRKNFIWVEACDYGVGKSDPTLIGYFKCYKNGLIVMEKEIVLYEARLSEWIQAILEARYALDMNYYIESDRINTGIYFDPETGIEVRKPHISIGDKSYLYRKSGMDTERILANDLARRKIFTKPASGAKIENGMVILKSMIAERHILFKESCRHSIDMMSKWVMKVNEKNGKEEYNSPHDHIGDVLRYMLEAIPSNQYVSRIKENDEFFEKQKLVGMERLKDYRRKQKYNL
jgi:hypothetical protein